jgi:four helix bundle protein
MKKTTDILAISFDFSLRIIELYKILLSRKEYVLSRQLLKSATSIGANIREATAAQTKKDFIAKMAISSKEARETQYWLLLIEAAFPDMNMRQHINQIESIIRILTKIVKTAQRNNGLNSK